jgi:hypothetical protein
VGRPAKVFYIQHRHRLTLIKCTVIRTGVAHQGYIHGFIKTLRQETDFSAPVFFALECLEVTGRSNVPGFQKEQRFLFDEGLPEASV